MNFVVSDDNLTCVVICTHHIINLINLLPYSISVINYC